VSTATKAKPLKLTREERKEAFAGTLKVLRRIDKPEEGAESRSSTRAMTTRVWRLENASWTEGNR
jgi:hypothetical protein